MDDEAVRDPHTGTTPAATPPKSDGVIGRLQRVCRDAALALSASGVGVSVMAANGVHGMATASDPATARIEELQFTVGEGPCVDAFASSRPVLVPDLSDGVMRRWPIYAPAVHDAGIRAVFAFPMQVGAARLGVLDVFRTLPGPLSREELGRALTFADVAVTALLDGQEHDNTAPDGPIGLDEAVEHRAEIFQAQGMVMVQLGVPISEALVRIRAYAYAENRPLNDVAADIVARRLRFDQDRPGAPR
jgi:GAF domain-containing protein